MFIQDINPILFETSIFTIRWYGLFLALGVTTVVAVLHRLYIQKKFPKDFALDMSLWLIIGGLIGARLGHAIFYNPNFFLHHPFEIFFINHGGLASHGMILGILMSLYIYTKKKKILFKDIIDILVIPLPLLATFIRFGNFFNSEIIGTITNVPWAVHFTYIDTAIVYRHPVQLYEALLGLFVFGISYVVYKRYKLQETNKEQMTRFKQPYAITALVIFLYFTGRFIAEFFKARMVFEHGLSMGQWLSIPFIMISIGWFSFTYYRRHGIRN